MLVLFSEIIVALIWFSMARRLDSTTIASDDESRRHFHFHLKENKPDSTWLEVVKTKKAFLTALNLTFNAFKARGKGTIVQASTGKINVDRRLSKYSTTGREFHRRYCLITFLSHL